MRLADLDQWCVGRLCDGYTYEVGEPGYRLVEFSAPLGAFLRAYMSHMSIPLYKRFWWLAEWRQVASKMEAAMNGRSVVWYARTNCVDSSSPSEQ